MNSLVPGLGYCNSITRYSRLKTRVVTIGDVPLGGNNPIRVQSMTTTDTMNTMATVEQSIRMIEAGCEYVRITAPSLKEAQNLENIKKELRKRGYTTPLIADIHYTPNAAEQAARIVEKVRVNPGNYADKKKQAFIDYSDADYEAELERIRERFTPLVKICKEYGTAMRIGTNHGSLSDRIMSRYGDTPLGMVESAMEFLRICEDLHYHDIVLSMKASNPQVMVHAYRLLIKKMAEQGMNYPLHLGVTEAGEGEDGRIKSAVGIGTLLEDGIGDTVRVSLTEDPEFEIPVAKALIKRYKSRTDHKEIKPFDTRNSAPVYSPFEYNKRASSKVMDIGGNNVPRIIADFSGAENITRSSFKSIGYRYSEALDKWNLSDLACDYVFLGDKTIDFDVTGLSGMIYNFSTWKKIENPERQYPLFDIKEYLNADKTSEALNFISITIETLTKEVVEKVKDDSTVVLIFDTSNPHGMAEQRRMFIDLVDAHSPTPVIIRRSYPNLEGNAIQLQASTDIGALLLDGFGDGLWIGTGNSDNNAMINDTAFGILQATRTRISKTEYISCPSCGRTLFDLQSTTAKIRERTNHLKGVKIGIMGCIVNGPGEMADADYGYVGTGIGKITLYKGKEVVQRNVDSDKAVEALIDLIKKHGDWVEQKD